MLPSLGKEQSSIHGYHALQAAALAPMPLKVAKGSRSQCADYGACDLIKLHISMKLRLSRRRVLAGGRDSVSAQQHHEGGWVGAVELARASGGQGLAQKPSGQKQDKSWRARF